MDIKILGMGQNKALIAVAFQQIQQKIMQKGCVGCKTSLVDQNWSSRCNTQLYHGRRIPYD